MEVTNQKIYFVGGLPAQKAGEWAGSKSSHWNSSKLILKPFERKEMRSDHFVMGKNKNYFSENKINALIRSGEEISYRSTGIKRKFIDKIEEDPIIKRGRKFIDIKYLNPKIYPKILLNHNIVIKDEKVNSTKQYPVEIKYCRNDYSIENQMGDKKRVFSLHSMRNCLEMFSPGDKIYKNVECSPDFFIEGGLVVGSTNTINYNKTIGKRANLFYQSLDLTVETLNKEKLWKNKILKENFEFDKVYVDNLQKWESLYLPSNSTSTMTNGENKPGVLTNITSKNEKNRIVKKK